jgi:glycosyltransferase involved in cell wall biosynthesis
MHDLTLVIPAKKEAECLPRVLSELVNYNYKLVISLKKDDIDTINSIKNFKTQIHYQTNNGYGNALTESIEKVRTKYFCIFNADGSFDPKEIEPMYKHLTQKNLDFLFASRYLKKSSSEDDTILTFLGNKIFSLIGKIFFNLPISDILYTFVIGKTKDFRKLEMKSLNFGFCVELPIKAKKLNFKIGEYASNERKRIAGKKKVNEFLDGFKILLTIIKLLVR